MVVKGIFWIRPSGKAVLVSNSCSSGWQHLRTVKGARDIASGLFVPVWLFGSMVLGSNLVYYSEDRKPGGKAISLSTLTNP